MDLITFLRARLDEDEQVARRIKATRHGALIAAPGDGLLPSAFEICGDRLLADAEAKRRIVDMHANDGGDCSTCGRSSREENPGAYLRDEAEMMEVWRPAPWPCDTLRLLALPYASHPDYRQEWRPA
ncbi:DUF6221 family protein [Micrococcus luteus]|uniref:DUF6221 family protein n=1 Tax=Micrococcus luteus TaxID=1270 RepID=UPI003320995E